MIQVVGPFELVCGLGSDELVHTHVALHVGLGEASTPVLLHEIGPQVAQNEDVLGALREDVRVARELRHPAVAATRGVVSAFGRLFVERDLPHGLPLARLVGDEELDLGLCARLIAQVCELLHRLHTRRGASGRDVPLVHGRLRPSSLMITLDGHARVTDIGLARAGEAALARVSGVALQASGYEPPEWCTAPQHTPTGDIYAAGVLLWELIAGRRLFGHDDRGALVQAVSNADIEPIAAKRPDVGDELTDVLERALARSPADRFESAREMQVALERAIVSLGVPVTAADVADWVEARVPGRVALWGTLDAALGRADSPAMREALAGIYGEADVAAPPPAPPPTPADEESVELEEDLAVAVDEPTAAASAREGPAAGAEADDEEEGFGPVFALSELLGDNELPPPVDEEAEEPPHLMADLVRLKRDAVAESRVLRGGARRWASPSGSVRVRRSDEGFVVHLAYDDVRGRVFRAGAVAEVEDLPAAPCETELRHGDRVELRDREYAYRVRVVPAPPMPPKEPFRIAARFYGICLAIAICIHALSAFAVTWIGEMGVQLTVEPTAPGEVFAEGKLKAPERKPKKHPVVKKKPPKPKPKVEPPVDPTEQAASIPKAVRSRIRKAMGVKKGSRRERAQALADKLTSPIAGEGTTLKEVVSNVDAIAARGRSDGVFKMGGNLADLPGGSPNIASGGGGAAGPLGGKEVTKGLPGLKRRKGRRGVRGRVSTLKARSKVKGELTRSEVQSALNKHMGRIQGCYERALLRSPDLSGKITFEWQVGTDGRVKGAKERTSTLGNAKVSACILKIIKRIRFPKPRGGTVTISYPFIFRSAS